MPAYHARSMTDASPPAAELPKTYVPSEHEPSVREAWDAAKVGHADPTTDRPAYTLLMPPPNVTAALHLGHAFNNTLQDILARHHRMRGYEVLWMPGTDHAGIATQTVVEKRLLAQGQHRTELGREAFVNLVQQWKDEYEATITEQLQSLGCSADWARQRFTMDPICAKAVRLAFAKLFADDLIYRGKRLVNWDPVSQTALADDEVESREIDGHFWYLRYPLVDDKGAATGEHVTVATTRPETMLGDTAVAVNPDDPERAALVGRQVKLPLANRIIPIIADDYVVKPDANSEDPKARMASGFLKVTPAHDPNDWDIGQRHGLEAINVMAPDGSINAEYGWTDAEAMEPEAQGLLGLDRFEARDKLIEIFRERGLLENVRPHQHAVGHSYRSHVPIEPRLSDQWYVRVSDDRLVGEAQRALQPEQHTQPSPSRKSGAASAAEGDEALAFHPSRFAKTYESWHAELRDWCISRQLWWGHQIPVWSKAVPTAEAEAVAEHWRGRGVAVQVQEPEGGASLVHVCPEADELVSALESEGFVRDEDVLDTWFSSALWPLNTMGWPEPNQDESTRGLLEKFNPTSVLVTGRDIITLWVSRMVMFNRYFLDGAGPVPFRDVCINPMIQDGHGQRMSKSLGNGVDPRDIIHSHGADALRFTLAQIATGTQDARLPVDMVSPHSGKTFAPEEITSPAGYLVAAPTQTCPDTGKTLVSPYGNAAGLATPSEETPLARNTSSRFDTGRNFCTKLWNAARFTASRLDRLSEAPASIDLNQRPPIDRWMVGRIGSARARIDQAVQEYRFADLADALYDLLWRDFCDTYLEAVNRTAKDDPTQQCILAECLHAILRLLHPVCPFVTETIGRSIPRGNTSISGFELPLQDGPMALAHAPNAAPLEDSLDQLVRRGTLLIDEIRRVRAERQLKPRDEVILHVGGETLALINGLDGLVERLAGVSEISADAAPAAAAPATFEGQSFAIQTSGGLDPAAERARLEKAVDQAKRSVEGFEKRLANRNYVDNAPESVVAETRKRYEDAKRDLAAAEAALAAVQN